MVHSQVCVLLASLIRLLTLVVDEFEGLITLSPFPGLVWLSTFFPSPPSSGFKCSGLGMGESWCIVW